MGVLSDARIIEKIYDELYTPFGLRSLDRGNED